MNNKIIGVIILAGAIFAGYLMYQHMNQKPEYRDFPDTNIRYAQAMSALSQTS